MTTDISDRTELPDEPSRADSRRHEVLASIAMAVVLLATAFAAWRMSDIGSKAGDAERQGLIQAIQVEDLMNIDWGKAYQEAAYSQRLLVVEAEVVSLERSGDAALQAQATNIRRYILPGLALLAGPLASELTIDGSLDLPARFKDLQAANAEMVGLDPQRAFDRAESYHAQQRWGVFGAVLLALSLFWLGLAEISRARLRRISLVGALVIFLAGSAWLLFSEIWWALVRVAAS